MQSAGGTFLGRLFIGTLFFAIVSFSVSSSHALPPTISFTNFLAEFQNKSTGILEAKQNYSVAEQRKDANSDVWQSRFEASPELSFLQRSYDGSSALPDMSNRSQNVNGVFTQLTPTGTRFELRGKKYLEQQNPIYQSLDRSYSAGITQDLFNNAFGRTQRSLAERARRDLEIAGLVYRQSVVNSCQEAFELYVNTFTQQEIAKVYADLLEDAKFANANALKLYNNRLITTIDKLSAESDLINTQLQAEQAQQKLINNKRQITAFMDPSQNLDFLLQIPNGFLEESTFDKNRKTLKQLIAEQKLASQEVDIERSRAARRTDVQLGVEMGQQVGRVGFNGPLIRYEEEYLMTSLKFGFDVINKTEDADLRNAIRQKNLLTVQQQTVNQTQSHLLESLYQNFDLLKQQQKASQLRVKLLDEKMKIAFEQTKKARLEFENYLLHRNAYLNQKINDLNLQKDLWLNFFAIQKEFAQDKPTFCEAKI